MQTTFTETPSTLCYTGVRNWSAGVLQGLYLMLYWCPQLVSWRVAGPIPYAILVSATGQLACCRTYTLCYTGVHNWSAVVLQGRNTAYTLCYTGVHNWSAVVSQGHNTSYTLSLIHI